MTPAQLSVIMPRAPGACADLLATTMARFGITVPSDQAAFLANLAHESAQLTVLSENLNYSAEALVKIWPAHFTQVQANSYARQPERIANRAYANRGGNGDESSGDGWRHRGAGGIQLTFHDNQAACAVYFGIPVAEIGDWLRTLEGACLSAGWFWQTNNISRFAGDFDGACDKVNLGRKTAAEGDAIGFADRLATFQRASKELS